MEVVEQGPVGPTQMELFPEVVQIRLCSENRCTAGHTWSPRVAIATCPGCRGPVLAVMMQNCPVCNEPVAGLRLRTDHLPKGGGIAALCRPGVETNAEVLELVMERNHWKAGDGQEVGDGD